MKSFIVVYNDEEYRLLSMKEIKELLKNEMKEFITENRYDLERATLENELDDLLMIDDCTNMATLTRLLNSYGYELFDLKDIRQKLNVVSSYLYNNTQEKDMFNRIEQVINDIANIMNSEV